MTPTANENEDLLRRHFTAINEQDWAGCADTLAEDITVHQAGEAFVGVEWFTNHWRNFYETIPDANIAIDEMLAEDDKVAIRITNTGTNDGELPGIESTGTDINSQATSSPGSKTDCSRNYGLSRNDHGLPVSKLLPAIW